MTAETPFYPFAGAYAPDEAVVERDEVTSWIRRVSHGCAWAVLLLGVMVLLGWALGVERLKDVMAGHVSMKANTALCFAAMGTALALQRRGSRGARVAAQILTSLVLCCAALTLAEETFGIDLRIDQMLVTDTSTRLFPGRMANLTAANFCLTSLSMLLLGCGWRARKLGQLAALMVVMAALTAIVGFMYGVKIFYGLQVHSAMAIHTGIGFLLLGTGLALVDEKSTLVALLRAKEPGGVVFRRALPWVVLLPVGLGWVYLHPQVNFGNPKFGMAWFAVTLVGAALTALVTAAQSLNRQEQLRGEFLQEREDSSAAVRKSERELRLVTDHLPTLLSYIDTEGRYVRVNRTYEAWLGRPADEIVGRSVWELLGAAFWKRTEAARARVLSGETVTFETAHPTVDGERYAQITYAPDMDEGGRVRGIACMVLDMNQRREAERSARQATQLAKANEDLQQMVVTDTLTGLKNRRAFDDRMQKEFMVAKSHRQTLSVFMLDVDNFKMRNDRWGHAAGDEVLRELGAILKKWLREPDMAARYGGEEFTVLLPGSGLEAARGVAERIREAVAEASWREMPLTVSIGVSTLGDEMMEAEDLLSAADAALYEAKRGGKNRVCCG